MPAHEILAAFAACWSEVPFPWLVLLLIAGSFGWLWIEFQATRIARSLPSWRRPFPVLPALSAGAVRTIRFGRLLVQAWVVLFLVVSATRLAGKAIPEFPPDLARGVARAGSLWKEGHGAAASLLPAWAPNWLRPAPATAAIDPVPTVPARTGTDGQQPARPKRPASHPTTRP